MGTIYMWTNTVNGKKYVGKCHGDVGKRKRDHISGYGSKLLKRAFDKYGIDNFTFEILHDGILDIFLDDYEVEAIKTHNAKKPNGYNLTDGGGGTLGYKLSAETKTKISKANKGRTFTPETRAKMSESRKGKALSSEHRRNISQAHKGKVLSPEHRKKNSEAFKGRTHTPETRAKMSESHKGKVISKETRRKLSEAKKGKKNYNFGKKHSAEHRRKLSEAFKGRTHTPETRAKMSESHKIPLWNDKEAVAETIRLYTVELKSLENIAEVLNVSRSTVTRVLKSNKIKIRSASEAQKGRPSPKRSSLRDSEEDVAEIIRLFTVELKSCSEIGLVYDVSEPVINSILKSNGVPTWEISNKKKRGKKVPHLEETKRKISKALESPERRAARDFYFSLPSDFNLTKKRQQLFAKYPSIKRVTIYAWIRKWQSESESTIN